ncbi:MAG: FAD-binding oxidoreductase [Deltaproteobacteria bacterium]
MVLHFGAIGTLSMRNAAIDEIINIPGRAHSHTSAPELEGFCVCGIPPRAAAVFPRSVDEIAEIMKIAHREGIGVIPFGGGTKIDFGNPPEKFDVALSLKNLNRVVEHEASDLVATAECGIPLENLQSTLRRESQFLAIDPRHTERGATLGGVIATGDFGARRHRYGSMRELLIGVKAVRADGSIVRGGSKVVKNVAGYDLPKLFVGSFGTLAILAEATFRLYPIPEASRTWVAGFAEVTGAYKAGQQILNSSLTPSSLQILNHRLSASVLDMNLPDGGCALAVRIESVREAAESGILKTAELAGGGGFILDSGAEGRFWDAARDFPSKLPGGAVVKIALAIAHTPRIFAALDEASRSKGVDEILASAGAGTGLSIASIRGEDASVVEALKSLRGVAQSLGGSLTVQEASNAVKSQIDAWGSVGGEIKIMQSLKSLFDAKGILNSGRFVGGI